MDLFLLTLLKGVFFFLATFGAANAIAVLKVGEVVRGTCKVPRRFGAIPYFGRMFFCAACIGFWIALAVSAWVISPTAEFLHPKWRSILVDAFSASGVIWLIHVWWRTRPDPFDLEKM